LLHNNFSFLGYHVSKQHNTNSRVSKR
jgi:hypothetical protein